MSVETLYIKPGNPWQNGYAESFHSRFRDEFLAAYAVLKKVPDFAMKRTQSPGQSGE